MNFKLSTFLSYVVVLSLFVVGLCSFIEGVVILDTSISIAFFTTNILLWFYLVKRVVNEVVLNSMQPSVGGLFFIKKMALLLCVGGMISILSLPSIIIGNLVVIVSLLLSGLPFGIIQELSNGQ